MSSYSCAEICLPRRLNNNRSKVISCINLYTCTIICMCHMLQFVEDGERIYEIIAPLKSVWGLFLNTFLWRQCMPLDVSLTIAARTVTTDYFVLLPKVFAFWKRLTTIENNYSKKHLISAVVISLSRPRLMIFSIELLAFSFQSFVPFHLKLYSCNLSRIDHESPGFREMKPISLEVTLKSIIFTISRISRIPVPKRWQS